MGTMRTGDTEGFDPAGNPIYTQSDERELRRQSEGYPSEREQEVTTARVIAGGSSLEVIGGAGAAVLAIVGLAGGLPGYMAAIATIAIGGALVAQGGSIAARWSEVMHELDGGQYERVEVGGGMSAEMLGGAAGIALGILALVGVMPLVLLSVAAIVFGGAVLFGGASMPELSELSLGPRASANARRMTREAVKASGATMALAGIGAGVLGIIALIGAAGSQTLTLILVSMLALGGALLLSGTSLAGKVAKRLA